jgi:hypothetical protein
MSSRNLAIRRSWWSCAADKARYKTDNPQKMKNNIVSIEPGELILGRSSHSTVFRSCIIRSPYTHFVHFQLTLNKIFFIIRNLGHGIGRQGQNKEQGKQFHLGKNTKEKTTVINLLLFFVFKSEFDRIYYEKSWREYCETQSIFRNPTRKFKWFENQESWEVSQATVMVELYLMTNFPPHFGMHAGCNYIWTRPRPIIRGTAIQHLQLSFKLKTDDVLAGPRSEINRLKPDETFLKESWVGLCWGLRNENPTNERDSVFLSFAFLALQELRLHFYS